MWISVPVSGLVGTDTKQKKKEDNIGSEMSVVSGSEQLYYETKQNLPHLQLISTGTGRDDMIELEVKNTTQKCIAHGFVFRKGDLEDLRMCPFEQEACSAWWTRRKHKNVTSRSRLCHFGFQLQHKECHGNNVGVHRHSYRHCPWNLLHHTLLSVPCTKIGCPVNAWWDKFS